MKKSELRLKYKNLRQQLTKDQVDDLSLEIANQCLKLDVWEYSFFHIFLPIISKNEVNTEYVLNILSGKDKHIIISKSNFKTFEMQHFLLTDSTSIKTNSYGIPEPVDGLEVQTQQIDVVFIPLLAYDVLGYRVGYGKGFYDRFLSQCKPKAIKIGLSFFEAEQELIENHVDDIQLDFCVTPKGVWKPIKK